MTTAQTPTREERPSEGRLLSPKQPADVTAHPVFGQEYLHARSTWDREETWRRFQQIVAEHGPWTAHNVPLGHGIRTLGAEPVYDDWKLRRIVQIVADVAPRPLSALRVLDLACLEGQYAVEFARRGATVVAIEGRAAHVAKTSLARDAWNLTRLDVLQDDVRNLHPDRQGMFDVVLCLGILYHLDAPDLFEFTRRVAQVCRGFAVFDTHVSLTEERRELFDGEVYAGRTHVEHPPDSTLEQRVRGPWASLDNPESFWLTARSLVRLLAHVGFTSVFECLAPDEPGKPNDRKTLTAFLPRSPSANGEKALVS